MNYPRRIKRLETQLCEKQHRANAPLADRVLFYLPHNHREDLPAADAGSADQKQIIFYDPEVGMPQEL